MLGFLKMADYKQKRPSGARKLQLPIQRADHAIAGLVQRLGVNRRKHAIQLRMGNEDIINHRAKIFGTFAANGDIAFNSLLKFSIAAEKQ